MTENAQRLNIKHLSISITTILICFGFICFADECLTSIRQSMKLCALVLIPSLFPFFVCSKILLKLGISNSIAAIFDPVTRFLFNVPGCSVIAFLFSILGGYPIGAKFITELYESKQCTKTEAERMLTFCNNSGPIFIIVTIGISLYSTITVGVILYTSHVVAAIISGIIFRNHQATPDFCKIITQTNKLSLTKSTSETITESIRESVIAILNLCGFIVFFSMINALITSIGMIDILSRMLFFLNIPYDLTQGFISGFLEITYGIYKIAYQQYNLPAQLCLTSFLISWSGFSVIFQVVGVIHRYRFSISHVLLAKMVQAIISTVITYLLHINLAHLMIPAVNLINLGTKYTRHLTLLELIPTYLVITPILKYLVHKS